MGYLYDRHICLGNSLRRPANPEGLSVTQISE